MDIQTPQVVSIEPHPTGAYLVLKPLPGQAVSDYQQHAEQLAMMLRVPEVHFGRSEAPGYVGLTIKVIDPLAAPTRLDHVPIATGWVLELGKCPDGSSATVPLVNRSGVVCAGQPGSGKTAGMRGALAAFIPVPSVQFAIIDGKGGTDWNCFGPRAFAYTNDDTDLAGVVALLEGLEDLRRYRSARMLDLRGTSSFWDQAASEDLPLVFIVIDECQTFFDANYHATKEGKALSVRAKTLAASLVKKGRSAGIVAICMTQKPTVDALPSAIRDDSGLRVSYRVSTREAADAVLGDGWASSGESPIGQPQGVCVYTSASGRFERARTPFIPESVIAAAAQRHSGLACDPGVPSQHLSSPVGDQ
ncbi:FtsK/SpoIIIE domain-containing protein [Mycobacteroides abscessus]|uniref:FtsK/SpoIIIE domain-containing protein n=1 Tax=Mycobacteroides abscessus TaxID=36809 RepID=UPI0013000CAB|nr:FtsK/SpoIIIE domain-containing protein [Mycobacteroides abscessus]